MNPSFNMRDEENLCDFPKLKSKISIERQYNPPKTPRETAANKTIIKQYFTVLPRGVEPLSQDPESCILPRPVPNFVPPRGIEPLSWDPESYVLPSPALNCPVLCP